MNAATLDKMRKMKLQGMYRAFKANVEAGLEEKYTPDEIIAHLIDAEWDERQNRNVQLRVTNARFRYKAMVEDIYYHADRNIDKNLIMRFTDCKFIACIIHKKGEKSLVSSR